MIQWVNDLTLNKNDSFKYFVSLITIDNGNEIELRTRMTATDRAYFSSLSNMLIYLELNI